MFKYFNKFYNTKVDINFLVLDEFEQKSIKCDIDEPISIEEFNTAIEWSILRKYPGLNEISLNVIQIFNVINKKNYFQFIQIISIILLKIKIGNETI